MGIIKIYNESIKTEQIIKLEEVNNISDAMSIWGKIKDWFNIGHEREVLELIKDTFFDKNQNVFKKIENFEKLKSYTGVEFKGNFKVNIINNDLEFTINVDNSFDGEKIKFSFDLETLEKESILNKTLSFISNYRINEIDIDLIIKIINFSQSEKDIAVIEKNIVKYVSNFSFLREKIIIYEGVAKNNICNKEIKINNNILSEIIKNNFMENEDKFIVINGKEISKIIYGLNQDIHRFPIHIVYKNNNVKRVKNIEEINNFLNLLSSNNKKLIYTLLYQVIFAMIKESLFTEDPLATIGNAIDSHSNDNRNISLEIEDGKLKVKIVFNKTLDKLNKDMIESDLYASNRDQDFLNFINSLMIETKRNSAELQSFLNKISNNNSLEDNVEFIPSRGILLSEEINLNFSFNMLNGKFKVDDDSSYRYSIIQS